MKVTVTGATGLIGPRVVAALKQRGDTVTVLSRNPEQARTSLGVDAVAWDLMNEPAPAVDGADAVVHLAGAPVAQRWNAKSKQAIHDTREIGTRNLVAGIAAAAQKPKVLVSSSAVGYYGARGDELLTEDSAPADDFLASVCKAWEHEADQAAALGLRVAKIRTGIVLDKSGGALKQMLPPFKMGVGGPVAGGKQYMPWIAIEDLVAMYVTAVDDDSWSGAFNGTAPQPVTNKVFSKALGKALHRPAFAPVPALALKALYGEMSFLVLTGQRAVPKHAEEAGFVFKQPDLEKALADTLA